MPGNQFQRMVFAFTVVITVHVNIFYSIYVLSRKSYKTNHSSTGSCHRELAVYQCSPFLELKKIGLSR